MERIILDSKRKMVCPFCAEQIRLNDMLFAQKEQNIFMDPVLASYYLNYTGKIPLGMKSKSLDTWRGHTAQTIIIEEDIVTGIVSEDDGKLISERACPKCHNVIPSAYIEKEYVSLFGKKTLLSDWIQELEQSQIISRKHLSDHLDQIYYNLCDHIATSMDGSYEGTIIDQKNELLRMNSQSYIFVLELDTPVAGEVCIDTGAVDAVRDIMDNIFRVQMLYKPTLFILYVKEEKKSKEEYERIHQSMLHYLENICQKEMEVCFWSNEDSEKKQKLQRSLNHIFQN